MNTKYIDLIEQTYDFPTSEFEIKQKQLHFHGVDLMELVQKYGSPLKFTYLPKISENINRAKTWFNDAFKKTDYNATYRYCYCTKSSHFKHVLDEALKNNIHIETSSAFDINIVKNLKKGGKINNDTYVICNGFKRDLYIENIASLIDEGQHNCIPVIDNHEELPLLQLATEKKFKVGIRIASEEDEIHSGKDNIVQRIFDNVGYEVMVVPRDYQLPECSYVVPHQLDSQYFQYKGHV